MMKFLVLVPCFMALCFACKPTEMGSKTSLSGAPVSSRAAGSVAQSTESTKTPEGAATALDGPFRFVFTDFHFENGTEVYRVDADGQVRDLFTRHERFETKDYCAKAKTETEKDLCSQMRQVGAPSVTVRKDYLGRYAFAPETLSVFLIMLKGAQLETLRPFYKGSEIDDGTTRTYSLLTKTRTTRVSAYSAGTPAEPEPLLALYMFLRKQRLAHEAERKAAREIPATERAALDQELMQPLTP
jgi:hypothetical protein